MTYKTINLRPYRRKITTKSVTYLRLNVLDGKSFRQIAAVADDTFQRVHQQVDKFPAELRASVVLCRQFCDWYDAQGMYTMPTDAVDAWVLEHPFDGCCVVGCMLPMPHSHGSTE